ncbi:hypothetical protein [Enterovirga rhinocerotis]|uniref:Holin n=1 Tax=Enterovirga rhinocerotis TaxID=1339210 RepID=A0A4R7BZS6_9HYPH|nr:hypothetical protein [Enterovirga rhinocerotis]TDR90275.1 hypothetical protein EV668_3121 [Enterovirga rhinocerotis]
MNSTIILSLVRQFLLAGGGSLVTLGYLDADTMNQIVGALMVLIASGWALYERRAAGLAKSAVHADPKAVMYELAKAPEVAKIVTTSPTVALEVPSRKVVGPAGG